MWSVDAKSRCHWSSVDSWVPYTVINCGSSATSAISLQPQTPLRKPVFPSPCLQVFEQLQTHKNHDCFLLVWTSGSAPLEQKLWAFQSWNRPAVIVTSLLVYYSKKRGTLWYLKELVLLFEAAVNRVFLWVPLFYGVQKSFDTRCRATYLRKVLKFAVVWKTPWWCPHFTSNCQLTGTQPLYWRPLLFCLMKIPARKTERPTPTIRYGGQSRVGSVCATRGLWCVRKWCVKSSGTAKQPRPPRASVALCAPLQHHSLLARTIKLVINILLHLAEEI